MQTQTIASIPGALASSPAGTPASTPTTTRPSGLSRLLNPGPDFSMITASHSRRPALQDYIAAKFYKDHNARVQAFLPYLLTMSCTGSFSSTVGIRPAADNRLFVETYLDQPVETYVSQIAGSDTGRNTIVEIGNLVATQPGASQLAFIMLSAVLYHAGFDWVVCTATGQVEHLLKKLDFTCHTLCAADKTRLGEHAADWGKYYETQPHVMVISVAEAMQKSHDNRLANAALGLYQHAIPALAATLPGPGRSIRA